ncbi:MAG: glycosyltransferase, partial [Bacteroidetes bacterium]|nr:glycosyltransferase [Bacteroidota bacterium]
HNVTVFHGNHHNKEGEEYLSPRIRVIRFSAATQADRKILGYEASLSFSFAEKVIAQLKSGPKPDVIETQEYNGIGYYLFLRKLLGEDLLRTIPVIVTAHAPSFVYLEYNHVPVFRFPEFWICEMEKFSLAAADLVISPTHYLVQEIARLSDAGAFGYHQLFNPYSSPGIEPQGPIKRHQYAVFGKMSPLKGTLQLLKKADELWNAGKEFTITWIGGHDLYLHTEETTIGHLVRKKYSKHIRESRLILKGNLPPKDWTSQLSSCHAVIIPSLVDNQPYTVIEAMAAGKVVVASMSGGQREFVDHGINGMLFDWHKDGDFERVFSATDALNDDQLRAMGRSAAEKTKMFDPQLYYEKKLRLIDEAIAKAKRPPTVFPFIRAQSPASDTEDKRAAIPALQNAEIDGSGELTVVVPYYNMGAYLDDCLQSILASKYHPLKIVIVDDGSTEKESRQKLQDWEARPEITVIRKENGGLSSARNAGAATVTSPYLAFLDPDDMVDPSYFFRAIAVLKQYQNVGFVGCWVQYFGASKNIWAAHNPEFPYLLFHNTLNSSALIYKTACFKAAGHNDPEFLYGMEDYDSVINMVKNGYHGVVLPEPLYSYRVRKDSMARAFTTVKQLYLYKLLSTKHQDLFKKYSSALTNLLNANGPGFLHDNPTFASPVFARTPYGREFWALKLKGVVRKFPFLKRILLKLKSMLKN